tara:strand:+ start:1812 stop:1970 length:159 start_codon:yes stop_codon:yes gene_type:complete
LLNNPKFSLGTLFPLFAIKSKKIYGQMDHVCPKEHMFHGFFLEAFAFSLRNN